MKYNFFITQINNFELKNICALNYLQAIMRWLLLQSHSTFENKCNITLNVSVLLWDQAGVLIAWQFNKYMFLFSFYWAQS